MCGAPMTEGQVSDKEPKLSKGRPRKFSTTVCVVILLFTFIYCTVVFLVVRPTLAASLAPAELSCASGTVETFLCALWHRCIPGWNGASTVFSTSGCLRS